MYILKTTAAFDSAHFLSGYDGKCANIHGHHWVIEAKIQGTKLQAGGCEQGMLIDFGRFKKSVRALADKFDHVLIYECNTLKPQTEEALRSEGFKIVPIPIRPTAENFAEYFFNILADEGLPMMSVAIYETPDNCAVYEKTLEERIV